MEDQHGVIRFYDNIVTPLTNQYYISQHSMGGEVFRMEQKIICSPIFVGRGNFPYGAGKLLHLRYLLEEGSFQWEEKKSPSPPRKWGRIEEEEPHKNDGKSKSARKEAILSPRRQKGNV